ncbi:MAG: glycosyltransferase family 4 protein [Patescibacteria group bacterium]
MRSLRIIVDYSITNLAVQAGGIENSAKKMIEGLRVCGAEMFPIRLRFTSECIVPQTQKNNEGEFTWHELHVPHEIGEAFSAEQFSWRSVDRLVVEEYVKFFKEVQPDLILINGFPWFQHYLVQAARTAHIPYIILHHGLVYKELPYIAISSSARHRVEMWEREGSDKAAGEIFITQQSLRVWRDKNILSRKNSDFVVPLPVDDIFFARNKVFRVPKDKVQIGWVGRWDALKRPEYVAQIASHLKRTHDVHAVTRVTRNSLILFTEEVFSRQVILHAPMPPVELHVFYASLDACILPSAFEAMGKVVIEAAASGIPTFITEDVCLSDIYHQTNMQDFFLTGKDIGEDVKCIQRNRNKKCTPEFLAYVENEHRESVAYPRLYKALCDINNIVGN